MTSITWWHYRESSKVNVVNTNIRDIEERVGIMYRRKINVTITRGSTIIEKAAQFRLHNQHIYMYSRVEEEGRKEAVARTRHIKARCSLWTNCHGVAHKSTWLASLIRRESEWENEDHCDATVYIRLSSPRRSARAPRRIDPVCSSPRASGTRPRARPLRGARRRKLHVHALACTWAANERKREREGERKSGLLGGMG